MLYRSTFLDSMAFGSYNKKTAKNTKFDWLSRDEKEVQKYIDDKNCGFVFTVNGFKTLFSLLKEISGKVWYNTVPTDLQILMISGDKDPVGEYGKGVTEVYKTLRKTGHTNTLLKLYPEARHELLNELNRDEVTADILHWLEARMEALEPKAAAPTAEDAGPEKNSEPKAAEEPAKTEEKEAVAAGKAPAEEAPEKAVENAQ